MSPKSYNLTVDDIKRR